jgi:hypothetical protein
MVNSYSFPVHLNFKIKWIKVTIPCIGSFSLLEIDFLNSNTGNPIGLNGLNSSKIIFRIILEIDFKHISFGLLSCFFIAYSITIALKFLITSRCVFQENQLLFPLQPRLKVMLVLNALGLTLTFISLQQLH